LSERLLVRALVRWLNIADDNGLPRLDEYAYPEPDKPHSVGEKAQARKIAQAQVEAGSLPVLALAHAYGPADDFHKRLQAAWKASRHGLCINRYGYLSHEKMKIVGKVCAKGDDR
jgi:hypothetical protein